MIKKLARILMVVLVGAGVFFVGGTNYLKFGRDIDFKNPLDIFNINTPNVEVEVDTPTIDVDTPNINDPSINVDTPDIDNPNITVEIDKPTLKATRIILEKPNMKLNLSGNAALLHWRKGITQKEFEEVIAKIRISDVETNEKYDRELFENPVRKYEYSNVKLSRNKYAWHISKWLIRNDEDDWLYNDPYTGLGIVDQSKVDYDHIIALKYAWEHGAYRWTDEQRNNFSYNIVNGIDVSSSANRSKGSKGPADWLPVENPEDYCWSYFTVAVNYDISMTRQDYNVCRLQIQNCLDTVGCVVEDINRTIFDD